MTRTSSSGSREKIACPPAPAQGFDHVVRVPDREPVAVQRRRPVRRDLLQEEHVGLRAQQLAREPIAVGVLVVDVGADDPQARCVPGLGRDRLGRTDRADHAHGVEDDGDERDGREREPAEAQGRRRREVCRQVDPDGLGGDEREPRGRVVREHLCEHEAGEPRRHDPDGPAEQARGDPGATDHRGGTLRRRRRRRTSGPGASCAPRPRRWGGDGGAASAVVNGRRVSRRRRRPRAPARRRRARPRRCRPRP
ncbi:MAG: hypothetical protein KatS3mg010_1095 [Acidimicrobiia bacterium]|nr:MAG: hypothetical protein KatS3mg010_1095 [Acidimicrobiia bacterium]